METNDNENEFDLLAEVLNIREAIASEKALIAQIKQLQENLSVMSGIVECCQDKLVRYLINATEIDAEFYSMVEDNIIKEEEAARKEAEEKYRAVLYDDIEKDIAAHKEAGTFEADNDAPPPC